MTSLGSQDGTCFRQRERLDWTLAAAREGPGPMFHATMRPAIEAARTLAQLDDLSRKIWQAHAAETVTDAEAQGLAELLHTRRSAVREAVAPVGIPLGRVTLFPPRRLQRAPERSVAIERRRRLACSGPMPPALASRFTAGGGAGRRAAAAGAGRA